VPRSATEPVLEAVNEALVDFDGSDQWRALRVDHGAPQLVRHHPGRLVALDAELALQLDC